MAQANQTTLVCHLEGTLLKSKSFFPYYMLVALEAGGPLRALLLLLLYPFTWALENWFLAESAAIRVQIFVATAGLRLSEVSVVSRAVLPKFFLNDLNPHAYRALLKDATQDTSSGANTNTGTGTGTCATPALVITSHPKIFVEHFLSVHIRADTIIGTDLLVTKTGRCTGLVSGGILDEHKKLQAVKQLCVEMSRPLVGLCTNPKPKPNYPLKHLFLSRCKDIILLPESRPSEIVASDQYLTPLVFHDGRLVVRPTPLTSFLIMLWMPIAFVLAIVRLSIGLCLPAELAYPITSFLGVRLRVRGAPPVLTSEDLHNNKEGVLFVCTHRSLADGTFLTMALRRKVRALTFSLSKLSELISPIKLTRLTRNREDDARIIDNLLKKEDIFVCPEGTTCREPFLLRFSPLFAELADRIVPVALRANMTMFHGTTARGYKFMDAFFFVMNPRPFYEVVFLEPIPVKELRESGRTTIEIANLVQKQLAAHLGYKCTNFNRRDKYNFLAGHDGNVQ